MSATLRQITYMTVCTVCDQEIDVKAWDVGIPGLAVQPAHRHCNDDCAGDWHVVHVRSGAAVMFGFGCPEAATAAAWEAGSFTDWTAGTDDVRAMFVADGTLRDALRDLADRYGDVGTASDTGGVPYDRNEVNA